MRNVKLLMLQHHAWYYYFFYSHSQVVGSKQDTFPIIFQMFK